MFRGEQVRDSKIHEKHLTAVRGMARKQRTTAEAEDASEPDGKPATGQTAKNETTEERTRRRRDTKEKEGKKAAAPERERRNPRKIWKNRYVEKKNQRG